MAGFQSALTMSRAWFKPEGFRISPRSCPRRRASFCKELSSKPATRALHITVLILISTTGFNYWPGSSGLTNRSCGVSIGLNHQFIKKHRIRAIYSPPILQGRGEGAVRIKNSQMYVLLMSLYFPAGPASRHKLYVARRLAKWAESILVQLTCRCMPLLGLDLNGRVGSRLGETHRPAPILPDGAIGGCQPELECSVGSLLRQFLQEQQLCAINTFRNCDPTYSSIQGGCHVVVSIISVFPRASWTNFCMSELTPRWEIGFNLWFLPTGVFPQERPQTSQSGISVQSLARDSARTGRCHHRARPLQGVGS